MQITLIMGLPGSGRTTLAQQLREELDAVLVSTLSSSPARDAISDGKDIIVDGCYDLASARYGVISEAKKYNIPVNVVVLATPFEECARRNMVRAGGVSTQHLLWAYRLFEMPSYEEGFSSIKFFYADESWKNKKCIDYPTSQAGVEVNGKKLTNMLYVAAYSLLPFKSVGLVEAGLIFDMPSDNPAYECMFFDIESHADVGAILTALRKDTAHRLANGCETTDALKNAIAEANANSAIPPEHMQAVIERIKVFLDAESTKTFDGYTDIKAIRALLKVMPEREMEHTDAELRLAYDIAAKHIVAVQSRGSLRQEGCDSMDYIEVPVTGLEEAIIEAYRMGRNSAR